MNIILSVWLVLLLSVCFRQTQISAKSWSLFKATADSAERCRFYRRWFRQSFLVFTIGGAMTLALLASANKPWAHLPTLSLQHGVKPQGLTPSFILGLVTGAAASIALVIFLRKKTRTNENRSFTLGDFQSLIPRTRREKSYALLLCLNAGIGEELFFRLALPLLGGALGGNIIYGSAGATILFGIMHWYQGWKGVAATTFIGAIFMSRALAGTSIITLMLMHAAFDIFALLIRPMILARFSQPAAQPSS